MLGRLVTIGDFVDLYHKLFEKKVGYFLRQLSPSGRRRVETHWAEFDSEAPVHWWHVPRIRKRWNFLVTGDEDVGYPEYVQRRYLAGRTGLVGLSPACGTGNKEMGFAELGCFETIDAFDVAEPLIRRGREDARAAGLDGVMNLFTASVYEHELEDGKYDLILFDSSIHHFKDLDVLVERFGRALKPDGIVVLWDYVGPAKFQWTGAQLREVNRLLSGMPREYRERWGSRSVKKREYRPGLLRMRISDPSEAVESDRILPALRERFREVEFKPLGGTILHLVLAEISHHFVEEREATEAVLDKLIAREDELLAQGFASDFAFGIYRKKNAGGA